MADLFHANGFSLKVTPGAYDPGITEEIDHQIRFMSVVKNRAKIKARELQQAAGSEHFDIVESTNEKHSRPRMYVVPSDREGIHQEIAQAVLFKAALGMAGK